MKTKGDTMNTGEENIIFGRKPVFVALSSKDLPYKLMVKEGENQGSIRQIIARAVDLKIPIINVPKEALDRINPAHQGVVAYISDFEYTTLESILLGCAKKRIDPLLLILDKLMDPYNFGAIIRSAEAMGANGIIVPRRGNSPVTPTVTKAASGATLNMPIAKVSNLAQTIDLLQKSGLWIAAADMSGEPAYTLDLTGPLALVIGGEGSGVSRLLKEKSDFLISIPLTGQTQSLNASVAAGIALYEINRQRGSRKTLHKKDV